MNYHPLKLLERNCRVLLGLAFIMALQTGIVLVIPTLVRKLVDAKISFDSLEGGGLLGAFLALVAMSIVVRVALSLSSTNAAVKFKVDESARLIKFFLSLKYRFTISKEPLYFLNRISNTVNTGFGFVGETAPRLLLTLFKIAAVTVLATRVSLFFGFAFVAIVLLQSLSYRFINKKLQEKCSMLQRVCPTEYRTILGFTQSTEAILANRWQETVLEKVRHHLQNIENANADVSRFGALSSAAVEGLSELLRNGVLVWSVVLLHQSHISLGDAFYVQLLLGILGSASTDITRLNLSLRDLKACDEFIEEELLFHQREAGSCVPEYSKELRVSLGEAFAYNDLPNLQPFTFSFSHKSHVALIGASGCGKSTLLRLIAGVVESPALRINGLNASRINSDWYAKNMHFVPQNPVIIPGSIRDNLVFAARSLNENLLERICASRFLQEVGEGPNPVDMKLVDGGANLSGGQRQRIALCRALLSEAPWLLLDEATSMLDSRAEIAFFDEFGDLLRNRGLILIAHRISSVLAMNEFVLLEAGRIEAQGSVADLSAFPQVSSLFSHSAEPSKETTHIEPSPDLQDDDETHEPLRSMSTAARRARC